MKLALDAPRVSGADLTRLWQSCVRGRRAQTPAPPEEFISLRNMCEMMFGRSDKSLHDFNRSYYSWLYEDLSFVWSNSQWKCYGRCMNHYHIFSRENPQNLNPGAGLKAKVQQVGVHIQTYIIDIRYYFWQVIMIYTEIKNEETIFTHTLASRL